MLSRKLKRLPNKLNENNRDSKKNGFRFLSLNLSPLNLNLLIWRLKNRLIEGFINN